MTDQQSYDVPVAEHRETLTVANSRFISTATAATSVDEARAFINRIRSEMPDASHHVYAFRIGYGNTVTEGMSDDGEPSGTAGSPTLSVLRGTTIGDIVLVTVRYFGGTKLGTGGLVRAYSEAARLCLNNLKTARKIPRHTLGFEIPYRLHNQVRRLIEQHHAVVEEETFAANVNFVVIVASPDVEAFTFTLRELSAGQVIPVIIKGD